MRQQYIINPKIRAIMKYRESSLQMQCVASFRYRWPHYAKLLEHPKNEGGAITRRQGGIAKAEGVTAGVADLILHVPAYITDASVRHSDCYQSLAIELKTKKGTQRHEQKQWQRLFEAAGGKYVIIRSLDDFIGIVTNYMLNVPQDVDSAVRKVYSDMLREEDEAAKEQFAKLLNKQ